MTNRLNIGRIPYANLFPFFYYLEHKASKDIYRFVEGVPSRLNSLLSQGLIDVSPSSSIEYLRNRDKYLILPWFSISSQGPIRSIMLFSKCDINDLDGKVIGVSSESETSIVMLRIIIEEFLSMKCSFRGFDPGSNGNIIPSFDAILHIGDTAMIEAKKTATNGTGMVYPHVYDLGELWQSRTGLPFVYALWVVRTEAVETKKGLIKQLAIDLLDARDYALEKLATIATHAPQKDWFTQTELIDYWRLISYDLTDRHLDGLKLFEQYAFKTRKSG